MSRFITRQDDDTLIEIESMEICKWRYNDVCCNDECPELADQPYPSNKCEGSCPYFEKEDGSQKTFLGWYTSQDQNDVNASHFTDLTPVMCDITLYAWWSE